MMDMACSGYVLQSRATIALLVITKGETAFVCTSRAVVWIRCSTRGSPVGIVFLRPNGLENQLLQQTCKETPSIHDTRDDTIQSNRTSILGYCRKKLPTCFLVNSFFASAWVPESRSTKNSVRVRHRRRYCPRIFSDSTMKLFFKKFPLIMGIYLK